ncbi:unnamed protein product [Didymodactylos carnosus]|uniref:Uncharacterized protein n=1 Tax=Didymodactylos carnosus TaxID=1234261 RepID=A0A8S2SCI6_9BILA|nr:unnamed protein product [Didymodactylos carnosus]
MFTFEHGETEKFVLQRGWNFSNAYEHAMVKQYEERKSDFAKYKKQCIEDGKNGELTDNFATNVRLKMLETTDYDLIWCCPTPSIGVFLKSKCFIVFFKQNFVFLLFS